VGLDESRKRIDAIDSEIVKLLNERAEVVQEIGKLKRKTKKTFYVPDREKKVLDALTRKSKGPLPNAAIRAIFKEVISASRSLEKPLVISYWGPKATFTHLASIHRFGTFAEYRPVESIADVFTEVERERADYGVIPMENSTAGVVSESLDAFVESELKICSEIMIPIAHHLLASCPLDEIRTIYSGTQPLAQCHLWLRSNLPNVEVVKVGTTAEGAEKASSETGAAAIGSKLAAEMYKLNLVVEHIEDSRANYTRFFVIGRTISGKSGSDKTSVMFSVKDRVGALYDTLKPFAKHEINLTKIESRPSKRKAWDYLFFVDFAGHCDDDNVKQALEALEHSCNFVKLLGSYPMETADA